MKDDLVTYARHGVWTPWSEVLCVVCDFEGIQPRWVSAYPERYEAVKNMNREELVAAGDYESLAVCDKCQSACWVRFDVAVCQRVGRTAGALGNVDMVGALEQTGGMCCALVVGGETADRQFVVTAMDGGVALGEYERTDEPEGEPIDWQDPVRMFELEFATVDGEYVEVDEAVERMARVLIQWMKEKEG